MPALNLVIFGVTSNLSQIKLIPALYDLEEANLLPKQMHIVGVARKPLTKKQLVEFFDQVLHSENRHHQHEIKSEVFARLTSKISYLPGHLEDVEFFHSLKDYLQALNTTKDYNTIFYLATYPNLYKQAFENLQKVGLNQEAHGFVRLMIEKPIGNDLNSAKQLNELLLNYFKEEQIYRLDHYLGKETLQNILTFRFGNNVFEHLINKDYIDHIQISGLEDFGIGKRGGYYDSVGALKDVGQNHLLQMIAFATMDQPLEFNNQCITEKRTKLLEQLIPHPNKIVFGQYQGYSLEESVDPDSKTDTFFAFKTELNNDRFRGVPIYVRGGKMLKQTVAEISIVFKKPMDTPFTDIKTGLKPNVLIYRIQPNEGIVLKIMTKKPGHSQELEETYMQFCYHDYNSMLPDPYEKLMGDAIHGDQTFFNDSKEVEAQWAFIDPLFTTPKTPILYEPGSYGPVEADKLIKADGREWLEPSNLFCKI